MAARDDDRIAGHRPTIRDVSRIAGVSFKTVSRVINDQQYVSEETRARVKAVMAELGFQPSQAARALAGHRSHQIALICDNPNPWFVYEVQFGVRSRCRTSGVRMIAQPYDRTSPTLLEEVVSLVDQAHPDGLVLTQRAMTSASWRRWRGGGYRWCGCSPACGSTPARVSTSTTSRRRSK
ncbi:LacI family DNA-binding transcriptional regulator [Sphingomonas sp. MMS24-JH45]